MSEMDKPAVMLQELSKEVALISVQQKETNEQMRQTDEKLERVGIRLENISNNQEDVAEEFFWNTISANPIIGGIKYDYCDKNITRKKGKILGEFDIVMINGKDITIIETKYKAHKNDVIKLREPLKINIIHRRGNFG